MKALILAAGLGSRLGLDIPKPMYEVNGKPVLEHNILLLKKHNVNDIFVNLHYKPEVVKDYFSDGKKLGVNINYSLEEELLGTSGAVSKLSAEFSDNSFYIVYGDNYTNIDLSEMLEFHKKSKSLATIAMFDPLKVPNSKIAGGLISINQDNDILSFDEGKSDTVKGYVNAGVYILEPKVLDIIPKGKFSDFGKDIFPMILSRGEKLKGYLTSSFVYAIDTKEALSVTEEETK